MMHPTNETTEPAPCRLPIRTETAPTKSNSGSMNIHQYHSKVLPMNAGSDAPPNIANSHETTAAHRSPTRSRKADIKYRIMAVGDSTVYVIRRQVCAVSSLECGQFERYGEVSIADGWVLSCQPARIGKEVLACLISHLMLALMCNIPGSARLFG